MIKMAKYTLPLNILRVHAARFLNYVWPFFISIYERVHTTYIVLKNKVVGVLMKECFQVA